MALIGSLLCVAVRAQELTVSEKTDLQRMEAQYDRDKESASLQYGWFLYREGGNANCRKADTVLDRVFDKQDNDPRSPTYGQWNWKWEGGEKRADLNNALFRAEIMFTKLWNVQDRMSDRAKTRFLNSCREIAEAATRRWDTEVFDIGRDFVAYSNIFVLYVQTLTLAADRFDDDLMKRKAKSQWTRWYNHVSLHGIDEFASPTYNRVVFGGLINIRDYCHDERTGRECREMLDHIYLLQSAITHPLLKLPVCGISRDYRNFLIQPDARSEIFTAPFEGYTPPERAVKINTGRTYPFEIIGKAAAVPFIFKSYQFQNAAMGSMTGGACFQQQIHCMAAVGSGENDRAVLFLQGSNTPVNGYTDQKAMSTLCVYNRLPALWHLTQWRGDMSKYRGTFGEFGVGISPNWHEKSHAPDRIVLEAYGYEAHVFPFALDNETLIPCDLEKKHRTSTSPRYHPRPREFEEYVFPVKPDWFGAHIILVKSGTEVPDPQLAVSMQEGVISFATDEGHRIRLFIAEKGDTRQLHNTDPATIPLLKIAEQP